MSTAASPRTEPTDTAGLAEAILDAAIAAKPGGSRRAGQDTMCAAVSTALERGRHLLVEAPTGTGKSLAYLAAAAAHATTNRSGDTDDDTGAGRVVISTATKALQDQLIDIDLPAAAAAAERAGAPFTYAMLKGRNNYVCLARLSDGTDPQLFGAAGNEHAAVADWARTTRTGERTEVGWASDETWAKVSVSSNECPGASECPKGQVCFTERARAAARAADIIVVNTHLYAAHVASGGHVLPPHDAVIFDEAHEVEGIFISANSVLLSGGRVRAIANLAGRGGAAPADVQGLQRAGDRLEAACAPFVDEPVDLGSERSSALVAAINDIGTVCAAVAASLADTDVTGDAAKAARLVAIKAVGSLADDVERVIGDGTASGVATWVEDPQRPKFRAARIDVAEAFANELLSAVTVVATSATLAVGASFDIPAARLGFSYPSVGGHDTLTVESPFRFDRQGILYIASHLPDPTRHREQFEPAARDELTALAEAAGGRTLALFTSWRAARAAAEHLREHTGLEVLCQGEGSRSDLVDAFSDTDGAVLCATTSFWTGLDLHGDRCTLVVIDRIPFGRPNDPIEMARIKLCEERGGNGFADVTLPAAATMLAQGVGRLIRTTSDRGVVAILDPRLHRARYRHLLLNTIPPLWRTNDRDRVAASLRRLDAAAQARRNS